MNFKEIISNKRRQDNKFAAIIRLIWQKPGISRKDIATELKVSKGAITKNINQLLEKGVLVEGSAIAVREYGIAGRNQIGLKLQPEMFYSVGICLYNNDFSKVVLLDATSKVIKEVPLSWDIEENFKIKCERLKECVNAAIADIDREEIIGAGVALPGVFDRESGVIYFSSVMENMLSFNLKEFLTESFGFSCFLINISHIRPVLENLWGAARGMKTFIMVDSGLGSGFFFNGRLYCGWQGHAGEFGYMQVRGDGELNLDGRPGTISRLGPLYKVTKKIGEIVRQGGDTKVKKYMEPGMDIPTIEMVVLAIEKDKDQLCAQLMAECFEYIACGVVNVAYLLNPEAIFMEDWTARCPECTVDIVRRKMGHYGVSNWRLDTKILSMQCGKELLAKGAAYMAAENILQKMTRE